MSHTNASGISFAENRTLRAFVLLYAMMAFLILVLMGTIYYRYSKELMLSTHRLSMQLEAESYIPSLLKWYIVEKRTTTFPKDIAYDTALYTKEKEVVASYLKYSPINFIPGIYKESDAIHFVMAMGSYGMKGRLLLFETRDDGLWLREMWQNIMLYGSLLFIILLGVGIGLSRLFLRPMREAVTLLDDFIKDTTHELNTPITTIITNVEGIDRATVGVKNSKKIERIDIAAKTISSIYEDLTYLVLHHKVEVHNEALELKDVVEERVAYFSEHIKQKRLSLTVKLARCTIVADEKKMIRVIDNLLSNAIKYTPRGGNITLTLDPNALVVADTGKGIDQEKIERIFERYSRFDTSVGGFGIGLHIVASILNEYGFAIEVESTPQEGTQITIFWKR